MDTGSFIFNVKTEDWYKEISNDVEQSFTHLIFKQISQPTFQRRINIVQHCGSTLK